MGERRGWLGKTNSCKLLSEERNCMQHKWNKTILSYFIIQRAVNKIPGAATILPLLPFKLWIWWCCRIIASYKQVLQSTYQEISVVFGEPVVKKSGSLFFLSSFLSVKNQNGWTSCSTCSDAFLNCISDDSSSIYHSMSISELLFATFGYFIINNLNIFTFAWRTSLYNMIVL